MQVIKQMLYPKKQSSSDLLDISDLRLPVEKKVE